MPTRVDFGFWMSLPPTKMVKDWIKKKYLPSMECLSLTATDVQLKHGLLISRCDKGPESKWVETRAEALDLCKHGYTIERTQIYIHEEPYEKMLTEVNDWYDKVTEYVTAWFVKNKFINLKSGSFTSQFCVQPQDSEASKCGAPVAGENNKVDQIKEKFGQIIVYLKGTTPKEDAKIKRFEKAVEKRFDCAAYFG